MLDRAGKLDRQWQGLHRLCDACGSTSVDGQIHIRTRSGNGGGQYKLVTRGSIGVCDLFYK